MLTFMHFSELQCACIKLAAAVMLKVMNQSGTKSESTQAGPTTFPQKKQVSLV